MQVRILSAIFALHLVTLGQLRSADEGSTILYTVRACSMPAIPSLISL
jgi:hypothetical protein